MSSDALKKKKKLPAPETFPNFECERATRFALKALSLLYHDA